MDPLFGIPVPIAVGVTAGSAESLGEFTGYAAGYGGGRILDKRKLYQRVKTWIRKRAFVTILIMGLMPSPVFDIAGLAAGASRVPISTLTTRILGVTIANAPRVRGVEGGRFRSQGGVRGSD